MSWYNCSIKCDTVSSIFGYCKRITGDRVVFFDGGTSWFTAQRASAHELAAIEAPALDYLELEARYRFVRNMQ